jgi:hypothetical protein
VTVPKFAEGKSMFVFGELFNEKSIKLRLILRNGHSPFPTWDFRNPTNI